MPSPFKHPKTGVYWFRRAVPQDLRAKIGRCELTKSLRTKDPTEAKIRYAPLLEWSDRLFQAARSGVTLSPKDISALAGKWLAQALERGEKEVISPFVTLGMDGDELTAPHDSDLDEMERADERGDLAAVVGQDVDALLLSEGLALAKDTPEYQALLEKVFRAKVRLLNVQNTRAQGDWSTDKAALSPYPQAIDAPHASSSTLGVGGPLLSAIFDAWAKERKPRAKTLAEFSRPIRRFIELHGDIPAAAIDKRKVRDFKDALLKLPASMTWKMRDMPLPRLLDHVAIHPPDRTLAIGSVNKDLGCLAAVLSWAAKQGHFDALPHWNNPAMGLKVQARKNPEEKRLSYDLEDLRRLFNSPVFTQGARPRAGSGEAAKWLPILALFTGARLNELGQLLTSDIKQFEGVWYIDINTIDEGKHVKTASSRRCVPIHPEVLRLGFLAHVEGIQDKGATGGGRIFPDLRPDKHGHLTGNWSKWWGRYSREQGITDRRKVFHSFRHTFKTACREARVAQEVHDAFTGHAPANVGGDYGNPASMPVAILDMQKVRYEKLDLRHIAANP